MPEEASDAAPGRNHNSRDSEPPRFLDLIRARKLWLEGEWSLLAIEDEGLIEPDRDRGLTAVYVASACHFCDLHEAAGKWARQALSWGCPPAYLMRVLAAGAHISLGRMAVIAGDAQRARMHMRSSSEPIAGAEAMAHSEARLSKEFAEIGMLQSSVDAIGNDLNRVIENGSGAIARHRIKTLQSELIQLRQMITRQLMGGQNTRGPRERDETRDGKHQSYAQLGQDLWVLESTAFKRGGFFVEFGATDGVLLSNTYLLEREFGWSGLLAEPNPEYFEELKKNRQSVVSDACITGKTGETVEFIMAGEFGGIKDYLDADKHADRRASFAQLPENNLRLQTISLHDFLTENNAPHHIDYISVDTEGSELDILRQFPFDKWDVSLWTVEHNYTKEREEIYAIMTANGYRRKEQKFDDWYFKVKS